MRLVGTTKPTIAAIRDRTHWNSPNLTPQDPVTLGLCSQIDLDAEVKKAARRVERERKEQHRPLEKGRHAAADLGDHSRAWGRSRWSRSWRPAPPKSRAWRPKPRSRPACWPSCARWAAPRRTSSRTSLSSRSALQRHPDPQGRSIQGWVRSCAQPGDGIAFCERFRPPHPVPNGLVAAMAELLLELFSEEIPARMQARAADDLKRLVTEGLKAQGLEHRRGESVRDAAAAGADRRGRAGEVAGRQRGAQGPARRCAGAGAGGLPEGGGAGLDQGRRDRQGRQEGRLLRRPHRQAGPAY